MSSRNAFSADLGGIRRTAIHSTRPLCYHKDEFPGQSGNETMKNQGNVYTDHIRKKDEGVSILAFYSQRYTHSSREKWETRIRSGTVKRNGRITTPGELLQCGDTLEYHREPWMEPDVPRNYSILHEDSDLLIVEKPSGLPVLPAGGFLQNTLLTMIRDRFGQTCSPIHRLGRGTSGAILFTRNTHSARFLGIAMRENRIAKIYLARAGGVGMPDHFSVTAPIGPVPYPPTGTLHAVSSQGKTAISHFRVIRRSSEENATIIEATIITGRPHQIRIHLSQAGFPLVGDPLFREGGLPVTISDRNGRFPLPGDSGYALHSWILCFPHPGNGMNLEIVSPPPDILNPIA